MNSVTAEQVGDLSFKAQGFHLRSIGARDEFGRQRISTSVGGHELEPRVRGRGADGNEWDGARRWFENIQ